MSNQQVSNQPTAAYYLTLIGGILGIIIGAILIFVIIGIWIVIANVLMIVYAKRLMERPAEHSTYGIYIIILSIFGGLNPLCLIGGILAITYQPTPTQPPTQPYQTYAPYTQPTAYASAKYCPQCGNGVGAEAQYCPKCGNKLSP